MAEELDLDAIEARYRIRIKYRRDIYANLDYEPDVSAEEEVLALVAECRRLREEVEDAEELLMSALRHYANEDTWEPLDAEDADSDINCVYMPDKDGYDEAALALEAWRNRPYRAEGRKEAGR